MCCIYFCSQLSNGLNSSANLKDQQIDMTEYLNDFSSELFSKSANFFSDTLKLSNLFPHREEEEELDNPDIKAVVQGKEVRVPPGE